MGTQRRWAHTRLMGGPWLAATVLLPVVLAVLASLTTHRATEHSLTTRTAAALDAAGIRGADVSYDGVVGTVVVRARSLPDGTTSGDVRRVAAVEGARSVTVTVVRRPARTRPVAPPPSAAPAPAVADECADPQAGIDALLGPDRVAFGNNGAVLPDAERVEVEQVAALLVRCGTSVDVVGHTADRAPSRSTVGIDRARAVAAALTAAGVDVASARGRRSDRPLGDNATRAGRVLNRYAQIVAR